MIVQATPSPQLRSSVSRHLQGAGGGGGYSSGGGYSGGGYYNNRPYYGSSGGSGGSVNGVAVAVAVGALLLLAILFCLCKSKEASRNTDTSAVPKETDWVAGASGTPCFAPGTYVGTYDQYGQHYSIQPFQIGYKPQNGTHHIVSGEGNDTIGAYYLKGVWDGDRLAMTKHYRLGTGNRRENRGHKVHIRLAKGGANDRIMKGRYYVRTPQFSGSGSFEIWCLEAKPTTTTPAERATAWDPRTGKEQLIDTVATPGSEGEEDAPPLPVLGKDYIVHTVVPSDTFEGLCLRYKVEAVTLRRVNQFSGTNLALAPSQLLIPLSDSSSASIEQLMKLQDTTSPALPIAKAQVMPPEPSAPPAEYDVGPGIKAKPVRFSAQAMAYPVSNSLRLSSRRDFLQREVDVVVVKTQPDSKFGIRFRKGGAKPVITAVLKGGLCQGTEVRVGDLLTEVNGETINGRVKDALLKLEKAPAGAVELTFVRNVQPE